jgi:hypothetical protein
MKKLITVLERLQFGFLQVLDGKWFMPTGLLLEVQGFQNNNYACLI